MKTNIKNIAKTKKKLKFIKNKNQLELIFVKKNIKKINNNSKKYNFFYNNNLSSISRILLSSFMVIIFFYMTPIIINFMDKNLINNEYANNSKKILAYTLNKKSQNKENQNLNEEDLLFDIFNLNDLETDTVRLSASTIKQLFGDTDYNLKDVRKKKLVKPVALTLLPNEIKMIETQKEKRVFYSDNFTINYKRNNNIK